MGGGLEDFNSQCQSNLVHCSAQGTRQFRSFHKHVLMMVLAIEVGLDAQLVWVPTIGVGLGSLVCQDRI